MPRRGSSGRFSRAVLASAVLHAAALGAVWVSVSRADPPPRVRVFRVDIVSPPPSVAGPPSAVPPAPEATAPEPEPVEAEPEPAPPPPAEPVPAPAPPRKEPAPAPRPPRKEPAPEAPRTPTRPRETAREAGPKRSDAKSARTPAPATGERPDPTSPGGEGVRIRSPGADCPSQAYCDNIARQVRRYFRRPADARSDRGNVCFRILPSGGVDDIEVRQLRGSVMFQLALMEAVEKAGQQRAFGALPKEFGSSFPVCVEMTPEGS